MRPQSDRPFPQMPRIRLSRARAVLIGLAIAVFVLLSSLRAISSVFTDFLWFDQLGFSSVWSSVLGSRIALGALFTGLFFAFVLVSLTVAERLAPEAPSFGPGEEVMERYRDLMSTRGRIVRVAGAFVLAIMAGPSMSAQWNDWVLFTHARTVGVVDPQFKRDIGFYLFRLPFLSATASWLFSSLLIVTFITLGAHVLNGGIRVTPMVRGPRVSNAVKAHLSVLLALVAAARGFGYWLDRFQLTLSNNGYVRGAGYTDIKARYPALNLLMIISLIALVLFVVNIVLRGWTLPVIAVALWVVVSVAVAGVYPRVLQAIVKSSQLERERPYIARNIEATRKAMGLDKVQVRSFDYQDAPTKADLEKNDATIRNARMWEPSAGITGAAFTKLQQVVGYFRFNDVDIDRYTIDGKPTQVVIGVRDLNPDYNEIDSWVRRHLTYTHGYGAVVAPANAATSSGQPEFLLKNLPPQGSFELKQPRVYFGEALDGYAIAGSDAKEIDFTDSAGKDRTFSYDGDGGVQVKGFFRKLAFALRFGDPNLFISKQVTPEARVLFIRDVRERAAKLAPFLHFDADPYPVLQGGRIVWVLDAYTTSNRYPYAQEASTSGVLPIGSGLRHSFNYVRNSVKVVVDAYDGSASFFVVDAKDPIAAAYRNAFPKLLLPGSQLDKRFPGLRAHLRYPEDLFRVQSEMFGQYHVTDPDQLFNNNDRWDLSQDPGTDVGGAASSQVTTDEFGNQVISRAGRMVPYYLMMRLPGEKAESFVLLQNLVPYSDDDTQQNLKAFMVAHSDPGDYGRLRAYVMPRSKQVLGPALVVARMSANDEVSRIESLLGGKGSVIRYGNLQVIPIEKSLLYVRPMFLESESTKLPELRNVVVLYRDTVAVAPTLVGALAKVFGSPLATSPSSGSATSGATGGNGGSGSVTATTVPGSSSAGALSSATLTELLTRAGAAYDAAQRALAAGDLGTYQRKVEEVGRLLAEAESRSGAASSAAAPSAATSSPATTTTRKG